MPAPSPSLGVRSYLWPTRPARGLWNQRWLIVELVRAELAARYKGSAIGSLWLIVYLLFLLTVYTFVFGAILRARWPGINSDDPVQFALVLFCGLLVFLFISECLSRERQPP